MKKVIKIAGLSLLALALPVAHADEAEIRAALAKSMPSVKVGAVTPSEISGLFEVTVGGNIFYVSENGKYLIQGHMVDVAARTDLTEEKLGGARKQALEKLGVDKMIVFKPK
ncbi:MAG: disulfide isomerase DsbC N-terminal domain-containing protein, partial [Methylococcaceae bacterium]